MGIWGVKTTIELPDSTFRRAKALAAARGISLKRLFTEALDQALRHTPRGRQASQPAWMAGFGRLADLKAENKRLMALIEDEFERVEPEDGH